MKFNIRAFSISSASLWCAITNMLVTIGRRVVTVMNIANYFQHLNFLNKKNSQHFHTILPLLIIKGVHIRVT